MGKKQTQQSIYIHEQDLNKKSNIEDDFQFQKRVQHKDLGKIDLFVHPQTREVLFRKQEIFSEKVDALYAIDFFKRLKSVRSDYVLTLRDYSMKTDSGLCSTSYVLSAYYPFKHKTLFMYMQEIIKIQKDLTEIELIQIMYSILQGMEDLKNRGITVHDICPKKLYYDPQNLQTRLMMCDQQTNYELDECKSYQLKKIMEKQEIFISPLLYKNLKNNNINFYLDQDKENSFALGLTLLQAGTNGSIQDIYSNQQELDEQKLQQYIDNFKWKYEPRSTLLYQSVLNLLQTSQSQRLTPFSLQKKIPPYNQMKPFLVPYYLQKEHKQQGNPQNPFNNVVEQSSGVFFNPLKESYMTVQNVPQQQPQQNAYTGINRGVFNKIENPNNPQKVVGFQPSTQQYNHQQQVNVQQNNQYQPPQTFQYNAPQNNNQTPQYQNKTIDYFDVSYEHPQKKQNVFYQPINDNQKDQLKVNSNNKQLNTYSHLFQTQKFLEVTQTPHNIQNKERQIDELHSHQQKSWKYSHQRFKDQNVQQPQRNHSQNKQYPRQTNNQNAQYNPLVYAYNQQPIQQYHQNMQYNNRQQIIFYIKFKINF